MDRQQQHFDDDDDSDDSSFLSAEDEQDEDYEVEDAVYDFSDHSNSSLDEAIEEVARLSFEPAADGAGLIGGGGGGGGEEEEEEAELVELKLDDKWLTAWSKLTPERTERAYYEGLFRPSGFHLLERHHDAADSSFVVSAGSVVDMARNQGRLPSCLATFTDNPLHQLHFSTNSLQTLVLCMDADAHHPPSNDYNPTTKEIMQSAARLGQHLGSLGLMQTIRIKFSNSMTVRSALVLSAVAEYCFQCQRLSLAFGDLVWDENRHLPAIQAILAAFRGHAFIEAVTFERVASFVTLRAPLQLLPTLKTLLAVGWEEGPNLFSRRQETTLEVETVEDAELLSAVFQIPTLVCVKMGPMAFTTEPATEIFCQGLAASNIKFLKASSWSSPSESGVAMANALTSGQLQELVIDFKTSVPLLDFFIRLGQGLVVSSLQRLELQVPRGLATSRLEKLFSFAEIWRIESLKLTIEGDHWSDLLDETFSQYIATNQHLRSLGMCYQSTNRNHSFESRKFLNAARTGFGSLDEITIITWGTSSQGWISDMKKAVALNLNRQKRLHGALYEGIAVAESGPRRRTKIVHAVRAVDYATRFEFLRSNYGDCVDLLLQEMAPSP